VISLTGSEVELQGLLPHAVFGELGRLDLWIDKKKLMWDSPTMSTSTVDTKKRIVLPNGRPGDVFDIQRQAEGRFLLIRLEKPERAERLTKKACMEAMRNAPLRPTMTWENLRKFTREP